MLHTSCQESVIDLGKKPPPLTNLVMGQSRTTLLQCLYLETRVGKEISLAWERV